MRTSALVLALAITLKVTPQVAFEPATVTIKVKATAGRSMAVELVSEAGYYSRSDFPIVDHTRLVELKRVPAGDYEVIIRTFTASGALVDSKRQPLKVLEGH